MLLNLQLPFAVIPLVYFTSDKKRMGEFASKLWVQIAAWFCASFILVLNGWLLWDQFNDWAAQSGQYRPLVTGLGLLAGVGFVALLTAVAGWPWLKAHRHAVIQTEPVTVNFHKDAEPVLRNNTYSRILVPLDHSEADIEAINNALALARMHGARIILLHVEEGVTSQMFGALASTAEITEGQDYLNRMWRLCANRRYRWKWWCAMGAVRRMKLPQQYTMWRLTW